MILRFFLAVVISTTSTSFIRAHQPLRCSAMQASPTEGPVCPPGPSHEPPPRPLPRVVPFSRSGAKRANVKPGRGDLLVDNAPFGRVFHSAVLDGSGRALYDLLTFAEAPGAIALPVDNQSRIALLRQWRPVPAAQPGMKAAFDYADDTPADVERGFWSLEVPRGFPRQGEHTSETAIREAREELGMGVSSAVELGFCNFNTAVLLSDIPIYAVLAQPGVAVRDKLDEAELIAEVRWYTPDEITAVIARGEIRCGLTLAALVHVFASREKLNKLISDGEH